jgi:hypothetical protein
MDAAMRIALRGNLEVTDSATGDVLWKVRLGNESSAYRITESKAIDPDNFPAAAYQAGRHVVSPSAQRSRRWIDSELA